MTAMNSYAVTERQFQWTNGYATFTMSARPGFIVGSEFTVSGVPAAAGFNLTYVAVAGTSGTTIVGNPLSGPVGLPQA